MNRAAIYARLSLADEKSTSTERQKKDCRDHAKSLGLEVVAEFTFAGSISVPSGGGSVDCRLSGSSMGCDVEFYVNFAGKHYYSGAW